MNTNLSIIIDYINDNFLYGSKLLYEKIEELFNKYPISSFEKKKVFLELESLDIKVINQNKNSKKKLECFLENIGEERVIKESELIKWFEKEKIIPEDEKKIYRELNDKSYLIIKDLEESTNDDTYYLEDIEYEDFEYEDLDDLLNDIEFKKEVENTKEVIDKKHNLDYIKELQDSEDDIEKNKALNKLLTANSRLIWKEVNKYKALSTAAFDVEDMLQSGFKGMIKAAEKFDISRENKFSTYAVYWIKQSITRDICDYSNTIRVPAHMYEKIKKCIRAKNEFFYENCRIATEEELASMMNLSKEEVNFIILIEKMTNLTSLQTHIGEDKVSTLEEFIVDESQKSTENYALEESLKSEIEKVMSERLKDRERRIISMRFGFIGGKTHTLEEVGEVENVTRERIRQIESKSLKKLRNPRILERLGDFNYDKR